MKTLFSIAILATFLAVDTTACRAAEPSNFEEQFYQSMGQGDLETVYQMFHPALREEVDRPVMGAWVEAAQANLGPCLSIERIESSRTQQLTGLRLEVFSKITFAKGVADGTLTVLDGQIIAFEVQSEKMADWFQGPSEVGLYAETAEAFITDFLSDEVTAAWERIHPALQEVVGKDGFETMMAKIASNGGMLENLQLRSHRFTLEDDLQTLILLYDLQCERASGTCKIEFEFAGMKGHLIAFDFE